MKALTICQPYAHLICLPDDHDRAKRVENRTWSTSYRGPLLIHAGKNRNWLDLSDDGTRDESYGIALSEMVFGAIIGVANLADCVPITWDDKVMWSNRIIPESAKRRWPWLTLHEHTEGPFCFVLTECRRFETAIPYKGAQGFFDVPKDVVATAIAELSLAPPMPETVTIQGRVPSIDSNEHGWFAYFGEDCDSVYLRDDGQWYESSPTFWTSWAGLNRFIAEHADKPVSDAEVKAAWADFVAKHILPSDLMKLAQHLKDCEACRTALFGYMEIAPPEQLLSELTDMRRRAERAEDAMRAAMAP